MTRNAPSNTDNVIDSRDVIARIEELRLERDTDTDRPAETTDVALSWEDANPDEAAELKALEALAEEAEGYAPDWTHGETLIRDDYFTEYAEELVRDIGDLPKDLPGYIANNIDWQGVADDLRVDYTSVDFDGATYWVR